MTIRFTPSTHRHARLPAATGTRHEPLEGRVLMAAATAAVADGLLTITGTDARDSVEINAGDAPGRVVAFINRSGQVFDGVSRISVSGGLGNDFVTVNPALTIPATLDGGAGGDRLFGGAGDDLLLGGDGSDDIFDGSGNDTVSGGHGNEVFDPGPGADSYSGGDGNDVLNYFARTADLDISLDGQANDGEAGEGDNVASDIDIVYGGSGNDRFVGSDRNDFFYGGIGRTTAFGLGGNDTLGATAGGLLDGGDGNDNLFIDSDGPVTLVGGNGDDRLRGGRGATYDPGPGLDAVNGLREDGVPDYPSGAPIELDESSHVLRLWTRPRTTPDGGADSVRVENLPGASPAKVRVTVRVAGETADHVADVPVADVKQIEVFTYDGDDRIDLSGINLPATIDASYGNDTVLGGDGNDTIAGGQGDDLNTGAGGDDTINDAEDNNPLDGGPGRDTVNGVREVVDGAVLYEAEQGRGEGAHARSAGTGYTGSGYMDFGSTPGQLVEVAVDAAAAGPYLLTVRYANGGSSDRPLQPHVNFRPVGAPLSFPRTGGWSNWSTVTVPVTLQAGNNFVALVSTTAGGPNIDSVLVRPLETAPKTTYQAESATLSGPLALSNVKGYTGTGFADYQHATKDYVEFSVDVAAGGNYALDFRYANGGAADRPLELRVDGQAVSPRLAFGPTGSWRMWATVTRSVLLGAGRHTVRLTAVGQGGPNLDVLTVQALG
jgi:Ca2+-binding RTX toxin-like protein